MRLPPIRQSRVLRGLLLALFTGLCAPAWSQIALDDDLKRLVSWLAGEWNNNEQVWQQKIDASDPRITRRGAPVEHLHHVFAPVSAPLIGPHVFYVRQSHADDTSRPVRQALYRFSPDSAQSAIRLEVFDLPQEQSFFDVGLKTELFKQLKPADLKTTAGCDLYWRFESSAQAFSAATRPMHCPAQAGQGEHPSTLNSTRKLTPTQIWIDEQTISRKVHYFEGWLWFRSAGPQASADDRNTSFTRKFLLHNEGQRMVVHFDDGKPSPYLLELAVLTYQNTRKPVLKFTLLERETRKTLTYVWANADATTLGMNLGWFQAGVASQADNRLFGF